MCDCNQDYWQMANHTQELLTLLEGLVAGLRGTRKKALDSVLADLKSNLKAVHEEVTSMYRQAYNDHHAVAGLERERRGLQKRIVALETEHKATLAKYKAALVDISKDLINTPAEMAKEILEG